MFGFEYYDMRHSVKRRAEEGNITEKEMNRRIERLDRERAKYYNYFSSQRWGARGNNDPMISTSGKDIKQVSVALAQYLKALLF